MDVWVAVMWMAVSLTGIAWLVLRHERRLSRLEELHRDDHGPLPTKDDRR
jgi:hypothetical protein